MNFRFRLVSLELPPQGGGDLGERRRLGSGAPALSAQALQTSRARVHVEPAPAEAAAQVHGEVPVGRAREADQLGGGGRLSADRAAPHGALFPGDGGYQAASPSPPSAGASSAPAGTGPREASGPR